MVDGSDDPSALRDEVFNLLNAAVSRLPTPLVTTDKQTSQNLIPTMLSS